MNVFKKVFFREKCFNYVDFNSKWEMRRQASNSWELYNILGLTREKESEDSQGGRQIIEKRVEKIKW